MKEAALVRILSVDPKETLPTQEMIEQGKTDLVAIYTSLPGINTFRYQLIDIFNHPLRGCLMGFTGHTSNLDPSFLKAEQALNLQKHITEVTAGRLEFVVRRHRFHPEDEFLITDLFNLQALRRMILAYQDIFPAEALDNPVSWFSRVNQQRAVGIKNEDTKKYHIYWGIFSGFPPKSVVLFNHGKKAKTGEILGVGPFTHFGTVEEDEHIKIANEAYKKSGMMELALELRKAEHRLNS